MGSTWASYVRVSSSSFADLTLALEDWIMGKGHFWPRIPIRLPHIVDWSPHEYWYPYPYRGGGRGQNQPVEFHLFFLLGNPGIVIHLLKWNFKVTFLDKPWALVRKYLRLSPEELSASMMMATQFLEGCHPYTCAASVWHVLSSSGAKRKYLIFICLPMIWNDEECWSLRKINASNGILKWNFSTTPPLKFHL